MESKMYYDPRIYQLPLFISFPRSGCTWINCVMEVYFDRPRLREGRPTFLPRHRTDWMWFHDHDLNLDITHDNVLYLYRNPVEVLYSYSMADYNKVNIDFIVQKCDLLKKHYYKYILNGGARQLIRYENFINDFVAEFHKVVDFFGTPFDENRLKKVLKITTKEQIVKLSPDKVYFNEKLCSNKYQNDKAEFKTKYTDLVVSLTLDEKLKSYFQ